MIISDFPIAFKLELDKTNSLSYPSFEPEEIDYWLNAAIRRFVKTRYSGVNTKHTGFQQDQKRSDDLRNSFTSKVTIFSTKPDDNVYVTTYPSDYWLGLGEEVTISYINADSTVGSGIFNVTEATIETYRNKIENTLSEHRLNNGRAKPIRYYGEDSSIVLITDGNYKIDKYDLTYIKTPVRINSEDTVNINNEYTYLPEHTHDEIVKLAVLMALESITDQRYQTYSNEVATME